MVTTKLNPYAVMRAGVDDAAPIWTDRTFRVMAAGTEAVCVDLGGDVRVMAQGPYHDAWEVGFDDPVLAAEFGRVRFASGAVATTSGFPAMCGTDTHWS